jgi:hypothetical protein
MDVKQEITLIVDLTALEHRHAMAGHVEMLITCAIVIVKVRLVKCHLHVEQPNWAISGMEA